MSWPIMTELVTQSQNISFITIVVLRPKPYRRPVGWVEEKRACRTEDDPERNCVKKNHKTSICLYASNKLLLKSSVVMTEDVFIAGVPTIESPKSYFTSLSLKSKPWFGKSTTQTGNDIYRSPFSPTNTALTHDWSEHGINH